MSRVDISVVIPVKNGQRYMDSVLRAVFSQKINSNFEVIIIDSGSADKTLDIIRKYPVQLYQIEELNFNHGLTRNYGISKSQGNYIILLTQDAIPFNDYWMQNLVNNLKTDESIAGVYSRQLPHPDAHLLTQIRVNRFFTASNIRKESQISEVEDYNRLSPWQKYAFCNFDNVSSCIRKEVWGKISFPETDFGEDIEWAKLVLERGYKIIYEPESIVYHSHDFSVSEWHNRNRINYHKLAALFGVNAIDNIYPFITASLTRTFKDIHFLWRNRQIKAIFSYFPWITLYSFFGALGQYRGIKGHILKNNIV